jgi:hypothetical protein
MTDRKFFQAFDQWWEAAPDRLPTKRARDNARAAFMAGCRAATVEKDYRFQAGRWIVTVRAPTLAIAKQEAVKILNRRARKIGAIPPALGWKLTQIEARS